MEEGKKQSNQEHVKIYDKEMYVGQEKLRTIVIIIVVFIIGFIAGYFSRDIISENLQVTNSSNYNSSATI